MGQNSDSEYLSLNSVRALKSVMMLTSLRWVSPDKSPALGLRNPISAPSWQAAGALPCLDAVLA